MANGTRSRKQEKSNRLMESGENVEVNAGEEERDRGEKDCEKRELKGEKGAVCMKELEGSDGGSGSENEDDGENEEIVGVNDGIEEGENVDS